MKYQNETKYEDDDGKIYKWKHPFFGTFLTALGQSFTMIFSFISRKKQQAQQSDLNYRLN
jgi:hypothetical protein